LNSCLVKDPNKRPSAKEILEMNKKFFEKYVDNEYILKNVLNGCLTLQDRFPKFIQLNEIYSNYCIILLINF